MYRMYALPVLQMSVKTSSVMYITIFLIILNIPNYINSDICLFDEY